MRVMLLLLLVVDRHDRDVEPGLDLVRSDPSLAFDRFHEFLESLRPLPRSCLGSVGSCDDDDDDDYDNDHDARDDNSNHG